MKIILSSLILLLYPEMCKSNSPNVYRSKTVDALNIGDFLLNFDLVQSDESCPLKIVEFKKISSKISEAQKSIFYSWIPLKKQKITNDSSTTPSKHKATKYLNQCETIAIFFGGTTTEIQKTIQTSLTIGRPAKDYFIFIGQNEKSFQILYSLLPQRILRFTLFVQWRAQCNLKKIVSNKRSPVHKNSENLKCEFETMMLKTKIPQLRQKGINLNGVQLEMTAVHIPPLIMINKKTHRPFAGMMYKLYTSAGKHFNITFNILGGLEGTGRMLPNKTWVGMVGDLIHRRCDLAAAIRVTPHRYGLIDMAEFLRQDPPIFITALPKGNIPLAAIIHPFTELVWFLIGLSFIAILPAIFVAIVTTRFMEQMTLLQSKTVLRRDNEAPPVNMGRVSQHLYDSVMIPLSLSLDQGIKIPNGTRFLSGLWMVFVIVLGTGYKDKLFAFLTFPEPEIIPTNILQLHERKDYTIIFHYWKSALFNLFNTSDHQVHKDLVKRFILEPNVVQCILLAVFEPKTVCIAFKSLASLTLASNTTLISEFNAAVFSDNILLMDPMYIGIGVQKDSIYTEEMSTISSMFRDTGFLRIWELEAFRHFKIQGKRWLESQRESKIVKQLSLMIYNFFTPVKPLEMSNFYIAFGILAILSFVTIFPFLYEFKQTDIFKKGKGKIKEFFKPRSQTPNSLIDPDYDYAKEKKETKRRKTPKVFIDDGLKNHGEINQVSTRRRQKIPKVLRNDHRLSKEKVKDRLHIGKRKVPKVFMNDNYGEKKGRQDTSDDIDAIYSAPLAGFAPRAEYGGAAILSRRLMPGYTDQSGQVHSMIDLF